MLPGPLGTLKPLGLSRPSGPSGLSVLLIQLGQSGQLK